MPRPAVPAKGTRRINRLWAVGTIVSVLSLGAVVLWALNQPAPEPPADAEGWLLLAAAVCTYGVATLLRGERWYLLLRQEGADAPRADAHGLTFVGLMGNTVLPARGGDGLRVYYMARRSKRGMADVAGSLIAERVLDVILLSALYLVLAQLVIQDPPAPDLPGGGTLIAAGAVALVCSLALVALALRNSWLTERLRRLAGELSAQTRRLRGRHGVQMLGLTALIWLGDAVNLMLIARAVGFDLGLGGALVVLGVGWILLLIPSGPGNAGTFDAAILLGAGVAGMPGDLALSFLVLARVAIFVPPVIVGLVLVIRRYGWSGRTGSPSGAGA